MIHAAFIAAALALLCAAAWRDLASRRIPDGISALLLAAGALARAHDGAFALALSLSAALAIFAVLFSLFSAGMLGGGDVKLISALAVGLPPATTWQVLFAIAVAGGVIACIYLLLARLVPQLPISSRRPMLARLAVAELRRIRSRRSMPYGLAVACGGAFVLMPGLGV